MSGTLYSEAPWDLISPTAMLEKGLIFDIAFKALQI